MQHKSLNDELVAQIRWQGFCTVFDFVVLQFLTWGTVVASGLATIAVSGDAAPFLKPWLPWLTLTPVLFLGIEKAFRFDPRSAWHARKQIAVLGLLRRIRDDPTAQVALLSAELTKLEETANAIWEQDVITSAAAVIEGAMRQAKSSRKRQ